MSVSAEAPGRGPPGPAQGAPPLLEAADLHVRYPSPRGRPMAPALRGVSLKLEPGETLGLVGESGCGKTTVARALMGLVSPSSGVVRYGGQDLATLPRQERMAWRGRVQIVFQDPKASLNPRMTVRAALSEVLAVHGSVRGRAERAVRADEILERVGLSGELGSRYPGELSGGERQRVGIARALAVEPDALILDEPLSSLDVSIQAQVLGLLSELQRDLGLAYLLITHDLRVVERVAHRVAVMYRGRIVEEGSASQVYGAPRHPYTKALLASAPSVARGLADGGRPPTLMEDVAKASELLAGCPFHARCPHPERDEECVASEPPLRGVEGLHRTACHKVLPGG